MHRVLGTVTALAALAAAQASASDAPKGEGFDWDLWKRVVVLDGGRPKPLDTQAWEGMTRIAGRSRIAPGAFATFAPADVRDWKGLVDALGNAKSGPAAEIASRLPAELLASLAKQEWDVEELQRDVARLDLRLDKLVQDFAARTGREATRSEFRSRATDASAREVLKRYDEATRRLDQVNQAKCELIRALNGMLPVASYVPEEFLPRTKGAAAPATPDVCLAHRRYIESAFGDLLAKLPDRQSPRAGLNFADRKYDPVESTLTLALTWSGWEDPVALEKAVASVEGLKGVDVGANRMTHIVLTDRLYRAVGEFDVWDATPLLDARYESLAPKATPETATSVSARNLAGNEAFHQWVQTAARMRGDERKKADMTTTDEKGLDLFFSYGSYLMLRTGQTLFLCPDQTSRGRIEFLNAQRDLLAREFAGKSHAEAMEAVRRWKRSLEQSPDWKSREADVEELARGLEKELKVQPATKHPLPPASVLELQARKIVSDIQSNWVNILDIFARPERMAERGYAEEDVQRLRSLFAAARSSLIANDPEGFNGASKELAALLARLGEGSDVYPSRRAIDVELHYNAFQPFLLTAVLSGVALAALVASLGLRSGWPHLLGLAALVAAVGVMAYGMVLRILIAGRPPVTNMYETIIWSSFVMCLLALVLGAVYRQRIIVTSAALVLTPATLLAYIMPPELGSSIDPLVPVLRDNFWLVIHVLTIVASYGAFLLAWMLGNVGLGCYLAGAAEGKSVKGIALYAYRAIQVGVLLLAAGTGLGGWWAAYSWGRFWGWDPKEVWALIALVGYLAILHARYAGLIRNFGFLVSCVAAFAGVLMSWYGVNFLLGKGLHAYAFGDGGQPYVFTAVAANLGYLLLVAAVHKARTPRSSAPKSKETETAAAF
jgi:ABC-type transport system involved in cytochrome c biogenesis permease subunit